VAEHEIRATSNQAPFLGPPPQRKTEKGRESFFGRVSIYNRSNGKERFWGGKKGGWPSASAFWKKGGTKEEKSEQGPLKRS